MEKKLFISLYNYVYHLSYISDLYELGVDGVLFKDSVKGDIGKIKYSNVEKSGNFSFGIYSEKPEKNLSRNLVKKIPEDIFHLFLNFEQAISEKEDKKKRKEFVNDNLFIFNDKENITIEDISDLLSAVDNFVLPLNEFLYAGKLNKNRIREFLHLIKSYKPPE